MNNNAILQDKRDALFNAHRHIFITSLHQGLIAIEITIKQRTVLTVLLNNAYLFLTMPVYTLNNLRAS